MRLPKPVPLLLANALLTVVASAQSPPAEFAIKKCVEPKELIGELPAGAGTVLLKLDKDGKPDTASIAVLSVHGLSVAGFRSVASRQLSACQFDISHAPIGSAAAVMVPVQFSSPGVGVGAATVTPAPDAPLGVESLKLPKDSFPMKFDDKRIEERPRRMQCKPPPPPNLRAQGSGSSQAAALADMRGNMAMQIEGWNQTHAGELFAELLVKADGKPGNQVRVIEVSNPTAASGLAEMLGGCSYVPGRYLGQKVAAFIQTRINIPEVR